MAQDGSSKVGRKLTTKSGHESGQEIGHENGHESRHEKSHEGILCQTSPSAAPAEGPGPRAETGSETAIFTGRFLTIFVTTFLAASTTRSWGVVAPRPKSRPQELDFQIHVRGFPFSPASATWPELIRQGRVPSCDLTGHLNLACEIAVYRIMGGGTGICKCPIQDDLEIHSPLRIRE